MDIMMTVCSNIPFAPRTGLPRMRRLSAH